MAVIKSERDIARGLRWLTTADPRLRRVAELAGPVPLRRRTAGFEGLAHIVTGQQLSTQSANAIWTRLTAALPEVSAAAIRAADDSTLRAAGLSAAKMRTLRALAAAVAGGLDLDALAAAPAEAAHAALTAVHGIGPWTADLYLLFCLGHADIFPAGDLALRSAITHGLALGERPSVREAAAMAEPWSPWRGVAARLFWAYYRKLAELRKKESLALTQESR